MQITSKKIYMTLAIVLIVFLLALPKLKIFNADKDSAGTAGFNAALPVSAYVVKPEKLKDQVQTTGTVLSNEEVELQSEISGRVIEIKFKEGSRVNKGALLVKINDAELQASLLKAEFEKNLAKDKEERGQKQLKIEAISQQDYDVLLNELNTKKAEIKLVLAQIEKTEIRAPFDGIVGLRYVSEGSFIVQNTKIANLLDINPVKVDFALPEKYVNLVQAGDKIFFRIQGFADEFEGEVYAIEPKINTTTRTLQLRASCPNPDGAILPGAFADVKMVLDEIPDALMLPTEALIPELKGQKVFLYKGGIALPQPVNIGIRTMDKIQVVDGIAAGDTVITSGQLQLMPGLPVNLTEVI